MKIANRPASLNLLSRAAAMAGLVLVAVLPLQGTEMNPPELNLTKTLEGRHPRLLVSEQDFSTIANRKADDLDRRFMEFFAWSGQEMLDEPVLTYTFTGRRLLGQSRKALKRITTWALLYRMNGDSAMRDRAILEMETIAAFPDWNPPHFLDVGEMSLALAIGTDWLWEDLNPEQRTRFLTALKDKAILPSLDEEDPDNWWIDYYNNWNPVCHAGLVASALMLAETEPELSERIIQRAIRAFPEALSAYQPDGAYPEGPSYWDYGTAFSAVLLNLLENAFGTAFGLDSDPAFKASGTFLALSVTPTGEFYNYADCGLTPGLSVPAAWFASHYGDAVMRTELERGLAEFLEEPEWHPEDRKGRMLPFLALWYPPADSPSRAAGVPLPKIWHGDGPNPVAFVRENWTDPDGLFLGFKGNDGSVSHAHLDAGSFIFEDEGVRWAIDLGYQTYNSLEQLGLGIWDRRQHADRWRIFRLGPYAHSLLLIDQRPQNAETKANITQLNAEGNVVHGIVDLTPVYTDQAQEYQRHFRVIDNQVLEIEDVIKGARQRTEEQGRSTASLRWRMVTRAEVSVDGDRAILRQDGKTLYLQAVHPERLTLRAEPLDPPPYYWDEPNPGVTAIDLWTKADFDGNQKILVRMSTSAEALEQQMVAP